MGGKRDRQSIRLPGYDYGQPGAYFVTISTWHRRRLFGRVVDGQAILSRAGQVVRREWLRTAQIRPEVDLDEFVIMPDHFHAIIVIRVPVVGAHRHAPPLDVRPTTQLTQTGPLRRPPRTLGSIISGFKGGGVPKGSGFSGATPMSKSGSGTTMSILSEMKLT